jgi:hypothetical protein
MANISEREIAIIAKNQFQSGKYEEALATLTKLKGDSGKVDPIVQHNIVITNYYLSNFTDSKKFQEELSKIKRRIEEKVAEQDAQDSQIIFDDSDSYVVSFNEAVINYQMRQYGVALSILEVLFQNIEPADEYLAIRICFLLAELYLFLKYKDKVSLIIAYLEKTFPQLIKDPEKTKEGEELKEDKDSFTFLDITPAEFKYNLHISLRQLHVKLRRIERSIHAYDNFTRSICKSFRTSLCEIAMIVQLLCS